MCTTYPCKCLGPLKDVASTCHMCPSGRKPCAITSGQTHQHHQHHRHHHQLAKSPKCMSPPINTPIDTPLRTIMDPKNWWFVDVSPFQMGVLCVFFFGDVPSIAFSFCIHRLVPEQLYNGQDFSLLMLVILSPKRICPTPKQARTLINTLTTV